MSDELKRVLEGYATGIQQSAQPVMATVAFTTTDPDFLPIRFDGNQDGYALYIPYTGSWQLREGDKVLVAKQNGGWVLLGPAYNAGDAGKTPRTRTEYIYSPSTGTTYSVSDFANIGKVKVSSNDTTFDYLLAKLAAGAGIALTELNNGGNEDAQIALNINGLTAEATIDRAADYLALYDASAGGHRKVLPSNLPSDGKTKVSADDTTPDFLSNKIVVSGGLSISEFNGGGNEDVLLTLDINGLGDVPVEVADNDGIPYYDASLSGNRKVAPFYLIGKHRDAQWMPAKNTSGATAAVGDVGYIDHAGEYKTTTTGNATGIAWCVVMVAGGNNSTIHVARRGRVTINIHSTSPSVGDYLATAASAGKADAADFGDHVFAVAITSISGGTVTALLLTQRIEIPLVNANQLLRTPAGVSDSDFVATINGAPSGATLVYNAPSSGDENAIKPSSSSNIAKLRLHNTTRGDNALISDVDVSTNTITFTDTVPAAWASTDTITARSQTNTAQPAAGSYFFDYEIPDTTIIPALAVAIRSVFHSCVDTGGQAFAYIHPFEADATAKRFRADTPAANASISSGEHLLPLVSRRLCWSIDATGSGTFTGGLRMHSVLVAAP
jgi:hypothetical protein